MGDTGPQPRDPRVVVRGLLHRGLELGEAPLRITDGVQLAQIEGQHVGLSAIGPDLQRLVGQSLGLLGVAGEQGPRRAVRGGEPTQMRLAEIRGELGLERERLVERRDVADLEADLRLPHHGMPERHRVTGLARRCHVFVRELDPLRQQVRRADGAEARGQHRCERRRVAEPAGDSERLIGQCLTLRERDLEAQLDDEHSQEARPRLQIGIADPAECGLEHRDPFVVDRAVVARPSPRVRERGPDEAVAIPEAIGEARRLEQNFAVRPVARLTERLPEPEEQLAALRLRCAGPVGEPEGLSVVRDCGVRRERRHRRLGGAACVLPCPPKRFRPPRRREVVGRRLRVERGEPGGLHRVGDLLVQPGPACGSEALVERVLHERMAELELVARDILDERGLLGALEVVEHGILGLSRAWRRGAPARTPVR